MLYSMSQFFFKRQLCENKIMNEFILGRLFFSFLGRSLLFLKYRNLKKMRKHVDESCGGSYSLYATKSIGLIVGIVFLFLILLLILAVIYAFFRQVLVL